MRKKFTLRLLVIIVLILGFFLWFIYELTWEGDRNIGILSHPCKKEYSIKISQFSKFDWAQPLYFEIMKNDKSLKYCYGQFDITNNTRENINSFEIHCYKNILYVTWKDSNIPAIMFDTQTKHLYPYAYEKNVDNKYQEELFSIIKKGNSKLVIE